MSKRLLLLILCVASVEAAPRKPKRQELAPDTYVQIIEQKLATEQLPAAERARLSVSLAKSYFRIGNSAREVEVLEDALSAGIADPKLAGEAHYYLGRTYQKLGETGRAGDEFELVWHQFPDCRYRLNAAMEIGDLMTQAGETNAAMEWYSTIIEEKPKAKIAFLARDKRRALEEGLPAEEITDESQRPVFDKQLYRKLDQLLYSQLYDKADEAAKQILSSHSRTNASLRAAAHLNLAHHYWMYGHVEGADKFLAEAIQTGGSRKIEALILAGHIKRGLGNDDAALGFYRQAIQAAPDKPMMISAYQQSVRLLLRQGKEAEAFSVAEAGRNAFARKPDLPAYLDRMANTLRGRGHPEWRTYAAQVAATATNQLAVRSLQQLASEAVQRQDWPAAERLHRQLLAKPIKDQRQAVVIRDELLNTLLRQSNTVAAAALEQSITDSLEKVGGDAEQAFVLYRLGKTLVNNGRGEKAEQYWQRAVTDFPDTQPASQARFYLARQLESRGELLLAAAKYEDCVLSDDEPQFKLCALGQMVRIKQALDQPIAASSLLSQARNVALQTRDAVLELNLAQEYRRNSDKNLAKELLDRGLADAELKMKSLKSEEQKLELLYLVAKRLTDAGDGARLAAWMQKYDKELLQNKTLKAGLRYSCYFMWIQATEWGGHAAEAEALAERVAKTIPEDSERIGHVYTLLADMAKDRGDRVRVRELAEAAFAAEPTGYFGNVMYFQTAVEDLNAKRVDQALGKILRLEQTAAASRGMLAGDMRWQYQFFKGKCLVRLGSLKEGEALIADAMAHEQYLPGKVGIVEWEDAE